MNENELSDIATSNAIQDAKDRVLKKTVNKQVREFELVDSDRVPLVEAANTFVNHMIHKQVMPAIRSTELNVVELPMSEQETRTYDSALRFLQRQFEQGYSISDPQETRVETEHETEFDYRENC